MNERLNLTIDIFDAKSQTAQALPDLDEQGLIGAILQEFCADFDFLGADPAAYRLLKGDDQTPLDAELPIGEQLRNRDHLVLEHQMVMVPLSADTIDAQIYLRDQVGDNVYKLNWLPAIIGRPDQSHTQNELLAVNLDGYATGLRVSRRHACIVEEGGQFFVEGLASNPTLLQREGELEPIDVTSQRHPIAHGDVIKLSRSGIDLRLIAPGCN